MSKESLTSLAQFDESWSVDTLDNGCRIVQVPRKHDERFYVGTVFGAGGRHDSRGKLGTAHFLEHMMFRGSENHPTFQELAEAFEWLGGEWNAATSHEHTEYWFSGHRRSSHKAIKLFAEFLLKPRLKGIGIERQIITRELEGEENEYGHSTDLDHHIAQLLWSKSTLANPLLGTKESLKKITLADLKQYREDFYHPRNMALSVVGGGDFKAAVDTIAEQFNHSFGRKRKRPAFQAKPTLKKGGPFVAAVSHPDNEYHLQISFRCGGEWDKDTSLVELVTRILADGFCSRLGARLREELGLVYEVDADSNLFHEVGTLNIYACVGTDSVDKLLVETLEVLTNLATKGPSASELERAVERTLLDLELLPSMPEVIGFKLAWAVLSDKKPSLLKSYEKIRSTTVEDIRSLCAKLFKMKSCAVVILGPKQESLEESIRSRLKQYLD